MAAKTSKLAVDRALAAAKAKKLPPLESLSDLNPAQKAFIADILAGFETQVMCSRRAGKSYGICLALLTLALHRKCNSIYIGLGASIHRTIWLEIWAPLVTKYCPTARMVESDLLTVFPNGSTVAFMNSDDLKYVVTQLGSSLSGLAIIDEGQNQPADVLDALLDVILPPALSDDKGEGGGVLCLSGTIPETPYGRYWDQWKASTPVRKHTWNRFSNGYLKNQRQALDKFLASRPALKESSALIQRDWFGLEVFDTNARAWSGFVDALYPDGNLYEGDAPHCQHHSGAADPGGQDEYAITMLGWSDRDPSHLIWEVEEFTTPEGAKIKWSAAGAEIVRMDNKYNHPPWVFDSNSANTMDLLASDFGVVMMQPATKAAFRAQFDRMNDLLAQRRLLIRKGGALHRDMMLAKFSREYLTTRKGDPWDKSYHGNQHDSCRYALGAYFASRKNTERIFLTEAEQEALALQKLTTSSPKRQTLESAAEKIAGKGQSLGQAMGISNTRRPLKTNPYGL